MFLKEFLKKSRISKKICMRQKSMKNYPVGKRLKLFSGISNEMVKDMLDVPKPVTDASSDYSDDFDESSNSDDDGKIRKNFSVVASVNVLKFRR